MIKLSKSLIFLFIFIVIVLLTGILWNTFLINRTDLPEAVPPASVPGAENKSADDVSLTASLAKDLDIPWALDFLPDGSFVFTERPGRVRSYDIQEGLRSDPLLIIDDVAHSGEGGLLGIAVHPDFSENQFIYVYYTYRKGADLANRVIRFRKQDNSLLERTVIIDNIPGASIHNGGRIKFGPDGYLYITTGDAASSSLAQDINSLAGKILRLKDDGTVPEDNPFSGSPVYSYGHRNPQGLAWSPDGRLWETEHGSRATDELNLIEPGKNYGWPNIRGDEKAKGLESPVTHSGSETWAPSGLAYLDGSLFFSGLRGQGLYEVMIGDEQITVRRHLNGNFGRLRDVVVGPDNLLYVLTSNRDGRGIPIEDDDRIIRINPDELR